MPGEEATSADAGGAEVVMLSLARRRSARTSLMDEKGRCRHELKSLIKATEQIQNQSTVLDRFAEVSKGTTHALHLVVVFVDGEGALGESAKLSVEQHGVRLAIVQELLLKAEPRDTGGDVVALVDDIQEVWGDSVEYPGDNNTVHARLGRVVEVGDVTEDASLQ